MLTFDLSGKIAVVTGGSSGLGRQFAIALAEQGADIAIVAYPKHGLDKVAMEVVQTGKRCLALECDVCDETNISDAVENIVGEYGKIDILVNNAGIVVFSKFEDHTISDWDKVINTNLRGVFLFSREVVKKSMKPNKYGKIINIASIGGLLGCKIEPSYCASKGGVVNLTRSMAIDLAPYNINVNAIGPGAFLTNMSSTTNNGENENLKYLISRTPFKRVGKEGELNGALIYFASDASSFTTGQTIYIDGGLTSGL